MLLTLCVIRVICNGNSNQTCVIFYSDSKTDKTTSMLPPEELDCTSFTVFPPLLFLKIPHTNEIFYVLSVSANYSLCVLSVLSAMENSIKLVEYSDSHSKIDKTTSMKVLSSPFYLLFNTNLFLCFLRCLTRVSRSVSSNCCFILNQLMQNN